MTIEELLKSSNWRQLQKIADRIDFEKKSELSWEESVGELLAAIDEKDGASALILEEFAPPAPMPTSAPKPEPQPELVPPPPVPKPRSQYATQKLRAMGIRVGSDGDKIRYNLAGRRMN